jgi:hypothetical protein
MHVLVDDDLGRLTLRTLRPWHRLQASCLATRLDRALAGGIMPEASVRLAARAARLTSERYRCGLAASLWRIVATVRQSGQARSRAVPLLFPPRPLGAMLVRSSIGCIADDLGELADSLAARGPVVVRGVAMVNLLIADGAGPLYRPAASAELLAVIRRAAQALCDETVL